MLYRRGDLVMTEERLNHVKAGSCFVKMSCNRMPQSMDRSLLRQVTFAQRRASVAANHIGRLGDWLRADVGPLSRGHVEDPVLPPGKSGGDGGEMPDREMECGGEDSQGDIKNIKATQ